MAAANWTMEAVETFEDLEFRCLRAAAELRSLRPAGDGPAAHPGGASGGEDSMALAVRLRVFGALTDLEAPGRQSFSAARTGADALRHMAANDEGLEWSTAETMAEVLVARSRLLVCALGVLGEARALLPPGHGNVHASGSNSPPRLSGGGGGKCQADSPNIAFPLLAGLEEIVIGEAEVDADSGDADVQFALGTYWSEASLVRFGYSTQAGAPGENGFLSHALGALGLSGSTVQLWVGTVLRMVGFGELSGMRAVATASAFAERAWAQDGGGAYAPELLVKAEDLLRRGAEATPLPQREERQAARALRLYRHAKLLAQRHHSAAAAWRYRDAAAIAGSVRRSTLASHALSRLSHFQMVEGFFEEALESASAALIYGRNALADYLQARLRRRLGKLGTVAELLHAEDQLRRAEGRLPSKKLEADRTAAVLELEAWRAVAEGSSWDLGRCLTLLDAARILICIVSSAVFE